MSQTLTTTCETNTTTAAASITPLSEKEKGNKHFQNKNYDAAVEAYQRALTLSPSSDVESQIRANLALVYQKSKRHDLAEEECTKALLLDGKNPKLWYRRSQIRESLQNKFGAMEDMKRSVELFDSDPTTPAVGHTAAKKNLDRLVTEYSEELLQKKREAIRKACEERIREKEMEKQERERLRLEQERILAEKCERERREVEELTSRIHLLQNSFVKQQQQQQVNGAVVDETTEGLTKEIQKIQQKMLSGRDQSNTAQQQQDVITQKIDTIQQKMISEKEENETFEGHDGITKKIKKIQQKMMSGSKDESDNDEPSDVQEVVEERPRIEILEEWQHKDGDSHEDGQTNSHEDSQTKKRKKKNKKKKKKSQKKNDQDTSKPTRRLSFGTVSAREYRRCMGIDGVPNTGGWPLGLSNDIVSECEWGTVEDVEIERYNHLKQRYKSISGKEVKEGAILETRQFDYKKREERGCTGVNPLFSHSNETERMEMLCRDVTHDFSKPYSPPLSTSGDNNSPPQPKTRKSSRKNRRQVHHDDKSHHNFNLHNLKQEQGPYSTNEIHNIQTQLEQIRDARCLSNQGCSCHKASLHPHHGKNKHNKKHHHKPIPESKLKMELRKRGMTEDMNKSRDEMEAILTKVMEEEPCCRDNNCECVRNGIQCQADVCGCWRNGKGSDNGMSLEEIKGACGNYWGMNVCSADDIRGYRAKYLSAKPVPPGTVAL